jgi:hypothetical protein
MTALTTAVWVDDATQGLMSFGSIREAADYYADNTEPGTYPLAACEWISGCPWRALGRLTDGIDAARLEAAAVDRDIAITSASLRRQQL